MAISIPVQKLEAIKVSEYLKRGFEIWKDNLGILVLSSLVVMGLSVISIGLLAGPMLAGFIKICSRLAKPIPGQDNPKVSDLFEGFDVFLTSLVLVVIMIVLSIVLAFVFGFFGWVGEAASFVVRTSLGGAVASIAMPLIAFKKTDSATEAFGAALNAIKAAPLPTTLLFFAAGVISTSGVFLLGIGVLLTAPFASCVYACVYNDLFREDEEVTVM